MALKSNSFTLAGSLSYTNKNWGTGAPISESWLVNKLYHDFKVYPDPCHNGSTGTKSRTLPHAYSFSRTVYEPPYGARHYQERNYSLRNETKHEGTFDGWWQYDPPWPSDGFDTSQADAKAIAKLYDTIKSSEVNLSTTIGEGRETLVMLAPLARSIMRTYRQLKKLKKKPVRARSAIGRVAEASLGKLPAAGQALARELRDNPLQTVGGLYLGWSVGLAPLLNDLENLRKHVLSDAQKDLVISAKGRSGLGSEPTYTKFDVYNSYGRKFSFRGRRMQRVEYGVTFKIIDTHAFENWRAGLAFRVTTAWELVTLSFVVDYFVKMGEFLESLEAALLNNGMQFSHGYKTQGTLYEMEATMAAESGDPALSGVQSYYLNEYVKSRRIVTSKNRQVLSSFPIPTTIRRKVPTMAGPLLNCAALLSQLISRK